MHHKKIEINGQKIAYYESARKGQPVLFLHGNSMSSLCFERQFGSPLKDKYRFVAMDLPGHGKSANAQNPQSAYSLPAYADIVCSFAKSLDLDNVVLVGWSLGGHVLLETIGRLQNLSGLMIFGTPPVGIPMAADAFLPNPLFPLAFKNELSTEEVVAWTSSFFKPDTRIPDFFFENMKRTDGRARESLGGSVMQGNYADEVKIVAEFTKPLAIVHGEKEPFANLSYIKCLSLPTLWRGEIPLVPDAGHSPHWEQPERFNNLLEKFIKDCNH